MHYRIKISGCRIQRTEKFVKIRYWRHWQLLFTYYSLLSLGLTMLGAGLFLSWYVHWVLGMLLIVPIAFPILFYSFRWLYELYHLKIVIDIPFLQLKIHKLGQRLYQTPLDNIKGITFRVDIDESPLSRALQKMYAIHLVLECEDTQKYLLKLYAKPSRTHHEKSYILQEMQTNATKIAQFLLNTIEEIQQKKTET